MAKKSDGGPNPVVLAVGGVLGAFIVVGVLLSMGGERRSPAGVGADGAIAPVETIGVTPRPLNIYELTNICEGTGLADAAEYSPSSPGRRPMHVASLRGGTWEDVGPPDRLEGDPELLRSEVELVGCRRPLPDPHVAQCSYQGYPNQPITHHGESVQIREARTGELLAETLVPAREGGCPMTMFTTRGIPIADLYNNDAVKEVLLDHAGDGTRPDLDLETQLKALCTNNGGVRRIAGAPTDPIAPVAVIAYAGRSNHIVSHLAGPLGSPSLEAAGYVVCAQHTNVTGPDCYQWNGALMRLADGALLFPQSDQVSERQRLEDGCGTPEWAESITGTIIAPVLAAHPSGTG